MPFKYFDTAEKIASAINEMFKIELLAGDELNRSVRANEVRQSPRRQGPPTRISGDTFKLVCDLVSFCQSIEQANGDPNRLDRLRMRESVSEMLNNKVCCDGEMSFVLFPYIKE